MDSCVVVVVRIKVNSGTSGDSMGPLGAASVAPSSLILSFFFSRSLSVMVVQSYSPWYVGLRGASDEGLRGDCYSFTKGACDWK